MVRLDDRLSSNKSTGNRYLVFAGHFLSCGGWDRFESSFSDLDKAKEYAENYLNQEYISWAEIVDVVNEQIVVKLEKPRHTPIMTHGKEVLPLGDDRCSNGGCSYCNTYS